MPPNGRGWGSPGEGSRISQEKRYTGAGGEPARHSESLATRVRLRLTRARRVMTRTKGGY